MRWAGQVFAAEAPEHFVHTEAGTAAARRAEAARCEALVAALELGPSGRAGRDFASLLERCLRYEPDRRLTPRQALAHPFLCRLFPFHLLGKLDATETPGQVGSGLSTDLSRSKFLARTVEVGRLIRSAPVGGCRPPVGTPHQHQARASTRRHARRHLAGASCAILRRPIGGLAVRTGRHQHPTACAGVCPALHG